MNHDPAPSAAARQPADDDETATTLDDSQDAGRRRGIDNRSSSPARKKKAGLSKKLQFMTHLMLSLDMVVFAELCALYYLDCSFFRLIIRAASQYLYLTPKSEEFLILLPAHRPHVLAIFVPNALCMLLHLVWSLPEAGEATRGYLHGGVIIDFVGQKAPTSKFSLLLMDCVVLALQCFMLAVWVERDRLRKLVYPNRRGAGNGGQEAGSTTPAPATTLQDLDAEERGVLRDGPSTANETSDVEMRSISERTAERLAAGQGDEQESHGLLSRTPSREGSNASLVDVLRSGNAVLADFHVVHAIRTTGNDYQSAAAYPLQLTGYTATLAALAAERRARLESRTRQRQPR